MSWIAAQPYYKVKRVVSSVEQKAIVEDRLMHLYQERIVTKYREFPISEVFDLSYRSIGGAGGLLYLHTLQGVYSYTVAADPQPFIEAYKELVQSSPGK
ncbi:hypothetical protein [Paenibacillus castaneae]|uniref:hypothetical protein n=1 Tax=Paenibacillus castaneae TaxID=474957 RepID=UPI000C9BC532|nr:hypothetical protein [Paenibacillus castaneae]